MLRPYTRRGNTQQAIRLHQEILSHRGVVCFPGISSPPNEIPDEPQYCPQDIKEAKLWDGCWVKVQLKAENKTNSLKTHGLVVSHHFFPSEAYLTFPLGSRVPIILGKHS